MMTAFDTTANKLLAVVFAFAVTTVTMAAAIVPATPAGFVA